MTSNKHEPRGRGEGRVSMQIFPWLEEKEYHGVTGLEECRSRREMAMASMEYRWSNAQLELAGSHHDTNMQQELITRWKRPDGAPDAVNCKAPDARKIFARSR